MEDGMKTGITERRVGVWKSEGFPMKNLDSEDRGSPLCINICQEKPDIFLYIV
jgi:hypothetical protein